ncbi:MAG TPA: acyl-CoA desaturase [Candidatus Saccharimonadia bacterium]|nr:acyl-CoA desaturase [Candidatus Saccharimonadia bacterium]
MTTQSTSDPPGVKPEIDGKRPNYEQAILWVLVLGPFIALMAAIPVAWGWGLGARDIALALTFYVISGLGVTVGFHRYLTHGAFKAQRWLRVALAIAGSLAVQGSPIRWVADHRRHHAHADRDGDPHSPWRFGTSARAVAKGMAYAHIGWLFNRERTNEERFTPDLLADKDIARVDHQFPLWLAVTLFGPALIGGLWSQSWQGALTAFFWASLVRISFLHHITWSVNSVCHVIGERPFPVRDKSTNFWPLAIVSFGESWHNSHHADQTCARHGVGRGQLDISARLIAWFEQLGWAYDVRWPRAGHTGAGAKPAA